MWGHRSQEDTWNIIYFHSHRYEMHFNQDISICSFSPLYVSCAVITAPPLHDFTLFPCLKTQFLCKQSTFLVWFISTVELRAVRTSQWSRWRSSSTASNETLAWTRSSTLRWNQNKFSCWWTNMNPIFYLHRKVRDAHICHKPTAWNKTNWHEEKPWFLLSVK